MLLHSSQNRYIFSVEKRDNTMHAVKVLVWADRAQRVAEQRGHHRAFQAFWSRIAPVNHRKAWRRAIKPLRYNTSRGQQYVSPTTGKLTELGKKSVTSPLLGYFDKVGPNCSAREVDWARRRPIPIRRLPAVFDWPLKSETISFQSRLLIFAHKTAVRQGITIKPLRGLSLEV